MRHSCTQRNYFRQSRRIVSTNHQLRRITPRPFQVIKKGFYVCCCKRGVLSTALIVFWSRTLVACFGILLVSDCAVPFIGSDRRTCCAILCISKINYFITSQLKFWAFIMIMSSDVVFSLHCSTSDMLLRFFTPGSNTRWKSVCKFCSIRRFSRFQT